MLRFAIKSAARSSEESNALKGPGLEIKFSLGENIFLQFYWLLLQFDLLEFPQDNYLTL